MPQSKIFNLLLIGLVLATALAVIAHLPESGSLSGAASLTDTPSSSTTEQWPTFNQENLQQYVVEPTKKGVPRTPVDYTEEQPVDFVLPVDQK